MKKLLLALIAILSTHVAMADSEAKLNLAITDPVKANRYFLCVYNVGCLGIKAGDKGESYPMPAMNVGNILQFVVTDVETMQEYTVPTNQSCDLNVHSDQKLRISGNLVIRHNRPQIENLRCKLT